MAKVLIVDDNPFFRELLCNVFNREPDFEVCGQAENGKEAVEKALSGRESRSGSHTQPVNRL